MMSVSDGGSTFSLGESLVNTAITLSRATLTTRDPELGPAANNAAAAAILIGGLGIVVAGSAYGGYRCARHYWRGSRTSATSRPTAGTAAVQPSGSDQTRPGGYTELRPDEIELEDSVNRRVGRAYTRTFTHTSSIDGAEPRETADMV